MKDAIRRNTEASYAACASAQPVDESEMAIISEQLGRPARGESAVVHRCEWGLPTAIRVDPHLPDGTPFPTVFWQTCPALRSAVGRLEADHAMVGCNERLQTDEDLASRYGQASERYIAFRDQLGGPLPGNPSAGGMPGYVKCLHVAVGHELATGDNPIGAWALDQVLPLRCDRPCVEIDA